MSHIVFWFLIDTAQVAAQHASHVLNLMLKHNVQVHPDMSPIFNRYYIMASRLRPPDVTEWKQLGVDVVGITASMDDMFPFDDLANAVETGRVGERRVRKMKNISQGLRKSDGKVEVIAG